MTTPEQIDRDAAAKFVALLPYQEHPLVKAFATHRQAALLEGIRLGIAAAASEAIRGRTYWRDKCEATLNKRESRDYETMAIACVHIEHTAKALDPATILAEHERGE